MDGVVPVWAIVLGVIGFLVNVIIGLLIWAVSQKLGDIKDVLSNLASADRELALKIGGLDRDLAAHKLYVSENYVRIPQHEAAITAIFNTLRETKEEIVDRVQELVRHLESRMVMKPPNGNDTK